MSADEDKFKDIFHQLDNVNKSLISIFGELKELNTTGVRHNEILNAHHARSTRLETIVESIAEKELELQLQITKIQADLKPVKQHVDKMGWFAVVLEVTPTALKVVATIVTIVTTIIGTFYFTR